jgi:hypothetical protein
MDVLNHHDASFQKLRIIFGGFHFIENEFHRFDFIHRIQQLTQNPDFLELIWFDQ